MNAESTVASERIIELAGRPVRYDDVGAGPPLVFIHGVWATGGIWDPVVARLSNRFRCIVPTLPLGVHRYPSPRDVDRSPRALARMLAELLEALALDDVTLVGNDTGGALCQLLIAEGNPRIGRVVLTNCDAFEVFPPNVLAPLYAAARVPLLWRAVAALTRLPGARRRFWATVARTEPDLRLIDVLMNRFARDPGVREDLRRTIVSVDARDTVAAARRFGTFDRDVLVIWGTEDRFFPVALGRRLAAAFPRARLELIERAMLFVMVDAPDRVASLIGDFVRNSATAAERTRPAWEHGA